MTDSQVVHEGSDWGLAYSYLSCLDLYAHGEGEKDDWDGAGYNAFLKQKKK